MSYTPGPPVGPSDPSQPGQQDEPRRRNPVLLGVLVGVLVFAVAAAGFAGWKAIADDDDPPTTAPAAETTTPAPSASPSETPQPASDPRLQRFYDQKLDWHDCGRAECSLLNVPLDYAKP